MFIKYDVPPNWEEVSKKFDLKKEDPIFYTYGNTLYSPALLEPSPDLIVHETTHAEQQGVSPELWWQRYLLDPEWRVEQEAEAYGNQFEFVCRTIKDRNRRDKVLRQLAGFLSGKMYGSAISGSEAYHKIKQYAHYGRVIY